MTVFSAPLEDHANGTSVTSQRGSALDLSPCRQLVETRVGVNCPWFELIIPTLKTISSRRFRKLTLTIFHPMPKIRLEDWAELDKEISVLAQRVKASAGNDALEVLIRCSPTVSRTQLSEIEGALPLVSSDVRVSLRTERLPLLIR